MCTGINSACPLFLCRADSQRAGNIPDAGLLRKLVRGCTCLPVLRGILDSLLHYLTQELPKRAAQDRNLKKPRIDETENSYKLHKSYGSPTPRDLEPRRITTFQLLQAKFLRSGSAVPVSHQRDVGSLSPSRGATSILKSCGAEDPEPKGQPRRGQGHKRGGSVKVVVAKFAMAEYKDKGKVAPKNRPLQPRLTGRGTALSALMGRFETAATVSQEIAAVQVRLLSNVKQMVACCERRRGEDKSFHKQRQPRKMRIKADLGGGGGSGGQEQGPGPGTCKKKSNPGRNNLKHLHQKHEDQCSNKTEKHPTNENSVQHGEIQSRVEDAKVAAQLKYGRLMVLNLKSVTETFLPEPCELVPQLEAQMRCHVGTIIASSPVWSTCVDHSPHLHPAEPPGAETENGCWFNPQREVNGGSGGDNPNLPESSTGQKSGPAYLIPRVNRVTFLQDVNEHASVACLPRNTEKPIIKIKDTQTEYNHHSRDGKTKEVTPVVTVDTNAQTKAKAAPEGKIPAVSSSKGHCEEDDQKLRPKYKTINYADPSVKETYKPKIIRFTDTFTF